MVSYEVRYWSEVLYCTILTTHMSDLDVKVIVIDLEKKLLKVLHKVFRGKA